MVHPEMGDEMREVEELMKYSRLSYEAGLVRSTGGNASVRIPTSGHIHLKCGGISMRDVTVENLVVMDPKGKIVYCPPKQQPSKELLMHLAVYRERKDINSVFHLHPPYTTSFAVAGKNVPLLTVSAQLKLKEVPLVGFAPPGSSELANMVSSEIRKHGSHVVALLLERHGILSFGKTVSEAFNTAELLEETAKIAVVSAGLRG